MTIRTTLSHVALHVRDLPAMERFYGDVLGLRVSDRGRASRLNCDMVFMSGNPEAHHQVVLMSGRAEEARLNPVNHMSFKIDSLAVLREIASDAEQQLETLAEAITRAYFSHVPAAQAVGSMAER